MPQSTVSNRKTFASNHAHARIEEDLRVQIANGVWQQGIMIPGQVALAKQYGVVRATIQRALAPLVADGTLVTNSTRGTFVASTTHTHHVANPVGFHPGQMSFSDTTTRQANVIYGIIINSPRIDEYHDVWYDRVVHAAERTATVSGSATRFASVPDPLLPFSDRISLEIQKMIAADSIAGLIVVSLHDDDQSGSIDQLMQQYQLPIVYVSSVESQYPVPHVYYDQSEAGFQAARHIINAGYSAMTFAAPTNMTWVRDRIKGAEAACRLAGLPPSALTLYPAVVSGSIDPNSFFHRDMPELGEIFDSQMPQAIIGCNDGLALKIMNAGTKAGKIAGRDYLLIGFDDAPESRGAGLTTLSPPLDALGEEAARLLPRIIDGTREGKQVRLRSHLVQRASSGTPWSDRVGNADAAIG